MVKCNQSTSLTSKELNSIRLDVEVYRIHQETCEIYCLNSETNEIHKETYEMHCLNDVVIVARSWALNSADSLTHSHIRNECFLRFRDVIKV